MEHKRISHSSERAGLVNIMRKSVVIPESVCSEDSDIQLDQSILDTQPLPLRYYSNSSATPTIVSTVNWMNAGSNRVNKVKQKQQTLESIFKKE